MSLRITPPKLHATTFTHLSTKTPGAPSAPGLHDTLRAGLGPSTAVDSTTTSTPSSSDVAPPTSSHPLESRLKQWETTQESLRMEMLRRTCGIAEPIRRGMELKIVRDGEWRPHALGGNVPSIHEDILRGHDTTVTWEDVYTGEESRPIAGMHAEMEKKLKI